MGLTGAATAGAQAVSTTTVQGTVYLANGQPGAGTLAISWPAFTTAAGQAIAADSTTVTIAPDGFVSVNLAPNVGATPAGEYYTAVYYMSDGSTSTQYWVVPAAASGQPGSGAGAGDAGGAGGADGEQGVCGPGDHGADAEPADGELAGR